MNRLTFVALTALAIISYRAPVHAQEAPSLTATLSPTPATTPPQPTPIPLADVITQADAAEATPIGVWTIPGPTTWCGPTIAT